MASGVSVCVCVGRWRGGVEVIGRLSEMRGEGACDRERSWFSRCISHLPSIDHPVVHSPFCANFHCPIPLPYFPCVGIQHPHPHTHTHPHSHGRPCLHYRFARCHRCLLSDVQSIRILFSGQTTRLCALPYVECVVCMCAYVCVQVFRALAYVLVTSVRV